MRDEAVKLDFCVVTESDVSVMPAEVGVVVSVVIP